MEKGILPPSSEMHRRILQLLLGFNRRMLTYIRTYGKGACPWVQVQMSYPKEAGSSYVWDYAHSRLVASAGVIGHFLCQVWLDRVHCFVSQKPLRKILRAVCLLILYSKTRLSLWFSGGSLRQRGSETIQGPASINMHVSSCCSFVQKIRDDAVCMIKAIWSVIKDI